MELNKIAAFLNIVIVVSVVALAIDNYTPLMVFHIPMGDSYEFKVLFYDKSNGFLKTMLENAKAIKDLMVK